MQEEEQTDNSVSVFYFLLLLKGMHVTWNCLLAFYLQSEFLDISDVEIFSTGSK